MFQKKHFFMKIKSTTHQALAWGIVWKDPSEKLVNTEVAPLKIIEIKNPFGSFQTNPQANAS